MIYGKYFGAVTTIATCITGSAVGAQTTDYSGALNFYLGGSDVNSASGAEVSVDNPIMMGGAGRVNLPVGTAGVALQFDLNADFSVLEDADGIDQNFGSSVNFGTHLSTRTEDYLVGAFVSAGVANAGEDEQVSVYMYGLEGQYNIAPNFQGYLQLGGFDTRNEENSFDGIEDVVFARVVGRYFLNETSVVEAEYNFGQGAVDPGSDPADDDQLQAFGLRYERQFDQMPVSWHVGYRRIEAEDQDNGEEITEDTIFGGVTFRFGESSIQSDLTRGAALSTPWAPGIWTGYAIESLDGS